MKNSKISSREVSMIVILVILLLGAGYYLFFYTPYQADMLALDTEIQTADAEIQTVHEKIEKEAAMKADLEKAKEMTGGHMTQIAPYDNKEIVFNMLYGILARSEDYSLNFDDPEINDDGTVRRKVTLNFSCVNYSLAKSVVRELTDFRWRCLVNSVSISGDTDIGMMDSAVDVAVEMTFFESTKLKRSSAATLFDTDLVEMVEETTEATEAETTAETAAN